MTMMTSASVARPNFQMICLCMMMLFATDLVWCEERTRVVRHCSMNDDASKVTEEQCTTSKKWNCVYCSWDDKRAGNQCSDFKCKNYLSEEDCTADPHNLATRETETCIWALQNRWDKNSTCDRKECKHYGTQEDCEADASKVHDAMGMKMTCKWLSEKCQDKNCGDYKDEDACKADEFKIIKGCEWRESYKGSSTMKCKAPLDEVVDAVRTDSKADGEECAPVELAPAPAENEEEEEKEEAAKTDAAKNGAAAPAAAGDEAAAPAPAAAAGAGGDTATTEAATTKAPAPEESTADGADGAAILAPTFFGLLVPTATLLFAA